VAEAGFVFVDWSGDLSGSVNPTSIVMDSDKVVVANFEEDENSNGGNGGSQSKTTTSKTRKGNTPPVADIGGPYEGYINEIIQFNASGSYDPDPLDVITDYNWDFGDTETDSGEIVDHIYEHPGLYIVTLSVFDNHGARTTVTTIAKIKEPNNAPEKPIIYGKDKIKSNTEYSYAARSTDSNNDPIKYIFEWGDGTSDESDFIALPMGTVYSMKHSWEKPGEYTLKVTVSDGESEVSSELTIIVEDQIISESLGLALLLLLLFLIGLLLYFLYKRRKDKPESHV
jgi:PKD repeat protein